MCWLGAQPPAVVSGCAGCPMCVPPPHGTCVQLSRVQATAQHAVLLCCAIAAAEPTSAPYIGLVDKVSPTHTG